MKTDRLKATAGKYGKVSKKGLRHGLLYGRFAGGYTGKEISEYLIPQADILDPLALDPGHLGPEEQTVYAAVVAGYFLGGFSAAKAVTKYQEMKEKDLEYTRPFLTPFDSWRKVKEFLDDEEEDEDIADSFEQFFQDEEE